MAEVRRPSYNHVQQTPRIGGCTGAFFNLFDWNNTKRLASTKRLPAERPEKPLRRSKSFRDDRSESGKGSPPSVKAASYEKADRGVVSEDEASSRPPGVVARLMGLESLPDATPSPFVKHRRSQSFSGSESIAFSDSRRTERLALRDLLKQEHEESFEKKAALNTGILVGPVEKYKNRQEKRTRKGAVESPIKSLVPYGNSSPTESCRSVYALPYVRGNDESKTPFLARLHPSPVLQPSKCHNQMVSPARTSPAAKKRVSRFLEAAVKILEEISDNEQCFPRERGGMRSSAEFADASPPSNDTDLLHCRSMSRIWNGSEDTESVGSRSTRSLMSRGSVSFRDGSQRRDRICRDIFETSLSERAQSVSPPRRPSPKGAGVKEPRILRTQEAAVGGFKTDVRKASPGSRKGNGEANSMSRSTDRVRHSQQTAAPVRERIKRLHFQATKISNGLEDSETFTSDEESLTHQELSSITGPRKFKTLEVDRSSLRESPRMIAMSSPARSAGDCRVTRDSRERIVQHETDATVSPFPQLRTYSTSVGQQDGLRPIKLSRNRGSQQENAQVAVSSNRAPSTEIPKSRGEGSSPNHSRLSTGQSMVSSKLSVRIKKDGPSKQEKQMRGTIESPAAPALQCHPPLPSAASLKRTRKKTKHGSPTLRESSGSARSAVRRTPPRPNMQGERRNHHNLEAKKSTRNPRGKNEAERSVSDAHPDIALPGSRIHGNEVEVVDVSMDSRDESLFETGNMGQIQGPAEVLFSSPRIGQCDNNLDELILGMEDLHWNDGMVENSSRDRYCQIRASGESICGALDEDVCNVDDASSPSPQKFAAERSEADYQDDGSTPVLMKRFLTKPLRLDVDMGETSPVSVLESPFGDEVCTTSESSITESEHRAANVTDTTNLTEINVAALERGIDEEEVTTPVSSTPSVDKVRQAILDISSFTSCDHERLPPAEGSPQTEKTFVREVLSAAQLLCSPGRSPNWYERDLAVDPSLFEKLEGWSEHGDYFPCESGGMWRCDRKLLFDCVNEAFSQNVGTFKDPQPWLRRPVVMRHRSVRQRLVEEVHEKIDGWRELASHAIDTLIDIDMSGRVGKWTDFSEEVSDIGAEVEGMVWQVVLEEVVLDLAKSRSRQ